MSCESRAFLKKLLYIAAVSLLFGCKTKYFNEKSSGFSRTDAREGTEPSFALNDVSFLLPLPYSPFILSVYPPPPQAGFSRAQLAQADAEFEYEQSAVLPRIDSEMLPLLSNHGDRKFISDRTLRNLVEKAFTADLPQGASELSKAADFATIKVRAFDLSKYKIVSVRFEPCFQKIEATSKKCHFEVRITAAPIVLSRLIATVPEGGGRVHPGSGIPYSAIAAEDIALHLTYSLKRENISRIVTALAEFKLANEKQSLSTAGKKLGVHPALQLEEDGSASKSMLARLKEFGAILKDAVAEENLDEAEFMATAGMNAASNSRTKNAVWLFSRLKVNVSTGEVNRRSIGRSVMKTCKGGNESNCENAFWQTLSMSKGILEKLNQPKYPNLKKIIDDWRSAAMKDAIYLNSAPTFEGPFGGGYTEVIAERKDEILTIARQLDDPSQFTIRQTDCISCHLMSSIRAQLSRDQNTEQGNAEIKKYIESFIHLSGFPKEAETIQSHKWFAKNARMGTAPLQYVPDGYNLHAFSYHYALPAVSQRVVNDSIVAARQMTELSLKLRDSTNLALEYPENSPTNESE